MQKTILIVEDHESLRRTLRGWIAESFPGWTCVEAASGEAAITLSAAEPPGVVLMDVELPGVDGIDAVNHIRKLSPAARFVVMSQHDIRQFAQRATEAGVHACLAKQELRTRLLPTLEKLLSGLSA